jgi:chaperonin GroEL (HSP60 family)
MPFGQGIDLHTGDEGEMKSLGVRDPLEVTVAALVAAGSVARMGILCEVVIAKQPLPVMRRPHHEHGHNYHGDPEGHTQTMPVAADQSD